MTRSHRSQRLFLPAMEMVQSSDSRPAVDPYEAPYGWLVELELAGVDPDDVRVRCASRHLMIPGVRRGVEFLDSPRSHGRDRRGAAGVLSRVPVDMTTNGAGCG